MLVKKAILDSFDEQDLVIVREYLIDLDYKSMSIYQALKEARLYHEKQMELIRKEETQNLKVTDYKDFDLKDLL